MDGPSLFEARDPWKPSVFSYDTSLNQSLFPDLEQESIPLLPAIEEQQALFDVSGNDFVLPPLNDEVGNIDSQPLFHQDSTLAPEQDDVVLDDSGASAEGDVWSLDFDAPAAKPAGPTLHTWEAFQLRDDAPPAPTYLSEAGTVAFDALIQRREKTIGVLPQDVVLRACCNLVLGRSSMFFQWDSEHRRFTRTIEKVPLSGLSGASTDGILAQFADCGTTFRRLAEYSSAMSKFDCAALVALRHCLGAVLENTERRMSIRVRAARSLLQMQSVIDGPSRILNALVSLMSGTQTATNDEEVICSVADLVNAHAESASALTALLQQIMMRVSTPWLQQVMDDLGLSGQGSASQSRVLEGSDPTDGQASQRHTRPRFIAAEDWRLLDNARASVKLLARHSRRTELLNSQQQQVTIRDAPALQSVSTSDLRRKRQRSYERSSDVGPSSSSAQEHVSAELPSMFSLQSPDVLALDWLDVHQSLVQDDSEDQDGLEKALDLFLDYKEDECYVQGLEEGSDLLAPIRDNLEAWSFKINAAVRDCIFEDYKLRDHLDLHRAFHLCGSGDFVARLTIALFSGQTQSAERKRGNIPTGQTMGLRLDSREGQRWPPASSELRLTLLSVLADSYGSDSVDVKLPGGLSFAIRELSDAEIDRVMDPTSIHALDFLRLQYTPPDALASILTTEVAQKYDSVFRTLLIHVRMLYTTHQLSWHCNNRNALGCGSKVRRFAWQARHFVTAISSHTMDIAIDDSWHRFILALDSFDPRSADHYRKGSSNVFTGISDISRLHVNCLDEIRSSMFLRRKHEATRNAVEDVFDAILKGAAAIMHGSTTASDYEEHDKRLETAKARLIQTVADMARKIGKDANAQRESEVATMLLKRLAGTEDSVEDIESV